jgi:hypothetical protein
MARRRASQAIDRLAQPVEQPKKREYQKPWTEIKLSPATEKRLRPFEKDVVNLYQKQGKSVDSVVRWLFERRDFSIGTNALVRFLKVLAEEGKIKFRKGKPGPKKKKGKKKR